jgi:asparagine synthase (glutamine-hydrolysing)
MAAWGEVRERSRPGALLGIAGGGGSALPVRDRSGAGLDLAAAARLDNRSGLADALGLAPGDRAGLADPEWAALAYGRWGEECPSRLRGDWAIAAWDATRRRLFLARDPLGTTGLFYHSGRDWFAFASDPAALLALPFLSRRISEPRLAGYLAQCRLAEPDQTWWEDVRCLEPGWQLAAGPDGVRRACHWRPGDVPALPPRGDEAWLEGFLERFRRAVATRLAGGGGTAVALSSGLDSGTILTLAAEAQGQARRSLTAFTSIPLDPGPALLEGRLIDEWALAHRVATALAGIDHVPLRADGPGPLAAAERTFALVRHPVHAVANLHWLLDLLEACRERGLDVLLVGQLGNAAASWSGGQYRIYHLFAAGRWREGRRALALWREYHGRCWPQALAAQLLLPWLRGWRARLAPAPGLAWPGWRSVHPALAARTGLAPALARSVYEGTRPLSPGEERERSLMGNARVAGPLWHRCGTAFGVAARDPTADQDLVEFCLGAAPELFTHQGGERMLLRRAMAGRLPEEVLWNRIRGSQGADLAERLRRHPDAPGALLARLAEVPAVQERLDLAFLGRTWEALRRGTGPAPRAGAVLLRGLMAGLFLEGA